MFKRINDPGTYEVSVCTRVVVYTYCKVSMCVCVYVCSSSCRVGFGFV